MNNQILSTNNQMITKFAMTKIKKGEPIGYLDIG